MNNGPLGPLSLVEVMAAAKVVAVSVDPSYAMPDWFPTSTVLEPAVTENKALSEFAELELEELDVGTDALT